MPNKSTDSVFQLIHSLQKSEKRNFKLYVQRNSSSPDLKIVQFFDALDKMKEYDEKELINKTVNLKREQLSNMKAHLYRQILASLRLLESNENIDIQLHEQLDYARILYNKGLYLQSLKLLDRVKENAKAHNQVSFLIEVLFLEKKIETLHITRSMQDRADALTSESNDTNVQLVRVTKLSNLALQLYSWYIKNGHARNNEDEKVVESYFQEHLAEDVKKPEGFYEKLYYNQSYCWYAFIRQDFLMYYRYSQKWIDLFGENEVMIAVETGHYIKGMHNLLNAHFDLRNFEKFETTLKQFEAFANTPIANQHDNFRTHTSIYINSARINQYLMQGNFSEGLHIVPEVVEKLREYVLFVDSHRILVFNYKIATLYFGSGDYATAIDFLHKIIHDNHNGLRNDLQCYSRLMHLLCHYELGNEEILDSLIKSVYRFMAKMKNLTVVEEEIFTFLRHSTKIRPKELITELKQFLEKIKHLEKNRFETRSFAYLDIISWVESKVYEKPMSEIIRSKYLKSRHR